MAKLTRVHIGRGFDEIGVQYEADDGAGGTITQKGFVTLPPDATTGIWAAAEAALAAHLALFPADMPIAEVAKALRQKRDAEAAAKTARDEERAAKDAAEAARKAAADARAEMERAAVEAEQTKAQAEDGLTTLLAETGRVMARKQEDEALLAEWMRRREATKAEVVEAEAAAAQAKREAAEARAEKAALEAVIADVKAQATTTES